MRSAAMEASVLCLAALVAARAAFLLRARRPVAARLYGAAPPRRPTFTPPPWVVRAVAALGIESRTSVTIGAAGAWMVTAIAGAAAGGVRLGALVAVAVPAGVLVWGRTRATRAIRRYDNALPAALEEVARGLRTGASLLGALGEAAALAGPVAADLSVIVEEASDVGLTAALDEWARRRPVPAVRLAVASLAMGLESGGAQASAIDGMAAGLRQRLAMAADLRAAGAQARLSGVVIALAPVAFAVVASAGDPEFRAYLFGTANGMVLLVAGIVLDVAGAAWMARLTRAPA